jgi:hypothetical protein
MGFVIMEMRRSFSGTYVEVIFFNSSLKSAI